MCFAVQAQEVVLSVTAGVLLSQLCCPFSLGTAASSTVLVSDATHACASAGQVQGAVLANTTSNGMHPDETATPVPAAALQHFELVFDAVYTPMQTQLLKVSILPQAHLYLVHYQLRMCSCTNHYACLPPPL